MGLVLTVPLLRPKSSSPSTSPFFSSAPFSRSSLAPTSDHGHGPDGLRVRPARPRRRQGAYRVLGGRHREAPLLRAPCSPPHPPPLSEIADQTISRFRRIIKNPRPHQPRPLLPLLLGRWRRTRGRTVRLAPTPEGRSKMASNARETRSIRLDLTGSRRR